MTRQRKEIMKQMEELEHTQNAEYEMGCGMFDSEISAMFAPSWEALEVKWAATYGHTVREHCEIVFNRQNEAYEAGRIPWSPCCDMIFM